MLRVFQHISKHEKKKKNGRVRKEIYYKENVTSPLSSIFLTFFNSSSSRLFERKRVWIPLCRSTFACELIFIQLPSTRIGRHRSRNNRGERVTRDEQPNKIVGSTSVWPRSRIVLDRHLEWAGCGAGKGREGAEVSSTTPWLLYQLDTSCDPFGNVPEFGPRDFPLWDHQFNFPIFLSHVVTIFP